MRRGQHAAVTTSCRGGLTSENQLPEWTQKSAESQWSLASWTRASDGVERFSAAGGGFIEPCSTPVRNAVDSKPGERHGSVRTAASIRAAHRRRAERVRAIATTAHFFKEVFARGCVDLSTQPVVVIRQPIPFFRVLQHSWEEVRCSVPASLPCGPGRGETLLSFSS